MKQVVKVAILAVVMNVITIQAFAVEQGQDAINQSDIDQQNKLSDSNAVPNASDSIEDWADNALTHWGRSKGEFGEKDGTFILFASQVVSLKAIDPQYGDALVNAFDKALMKLQEQYVMNRFGRTMTDKVKSFYSDRSTHANEINLPSPSKPGYADKVLALFDKSLDVSSKKLDKELVAMGESPQKVEQMPVKVKKDLYKDMFIKKTIRSASGTIAGLFPLQTSVAMDKKGNTIIGVIAIVSPKTIQISKDIKLQRSSLVKGKGRDIKTLLPQSDAGYLHTFGVRLTYALDGSPAIISYGFASYRQDTGDDYINEELKSEAKSDAVSNADAQIAELINGYMSVNNERKRGEEIKTFVEREVKLDSATLEKTIKNIIKITRNKTKSSASAKLQGISTVKTWRYTAATGQKYVGSVRVWKYSTLKAINGFNKGGANKKAHYDNSIKSSEPINSMADF